MPSLNINKCQVVSEHRRSDDNGSGERSSGYLLSIGRHRPGSARAGGKIIVIVKTLQHSTFSVTFNLDNLVFLFLILIRNTSSPFCDIKPKVFGSLFGAGVFVTTCVAGAVSIAQPFKLMERPFLRYSQYPFGGHI